MEYINEKKEIDRKTVILVNNEDKPIGKAGKEEAHKQPLLHRAFSVFLYNGDKMLIQQRALHKYHSGGLWANTCCSHPGDNLCITEDAQKRLLEETGIACSVEEIFCFQYQHKFAEDLYEHEYDHVMIGHFDGEFTPNPDEVEAMMWISFDTLIKDMEQTPQKFAPWFLIAAPRVIEYVREKVQK